jgi:hypothetical protein
MFNVLSTYWIWILFIGAVLLMHRSHGGYGGCGGGHASQHEDNQPEETQHDHVRHDSAAGTRADTPTVSLSKAPNTPTPQAAMRPSVQHAPELHSVS